MTTALKKEIQKLARESFREVLQEELVKFQPHYPHSIPVDTATAEEKRAIARGRKDFVEGKYHSLSEVLHEMDNKFGYHGQKISRKNSR